MYKNQCVSKQKMFWIQKILLEESVHMFKILRVLDMAGSYPKALLVCLLWNKGEDLSKVEKPLPRKDSAAHTTSCRTLPNALSSSPRLILHFYFIVSSKFHSYFKPLFISFLGDLFIYLALAKPALPGQFVLLVSSQSKEKS
jgi:hypothetical protein